MSRDEEERLRDIKDAIVAIPWTDVAGLRDLIAHEYFRIDIHRVLEIVERDLPTLEQTVDRMLSLEVR